MIKKIGSLFFLIAIAVFANTKAYAFPVDPTFTYTFTPSSTLVNSLSDGSFELWDIAWTPPAGQTIVSATLYIDDISNRDNDRNNLLRIFLDHYVSNPKTTYGLKEIGHNSDTTSWGGRETSKIEHSLENVLIGTYHDKNSGFPFYFFHSSDDVSFSFNSTLLNDLISYDVANGGFAIGFDPDCLFNEGSIKLKIVTEDAPGSGPPTPEPATISLLGLGFLGLFGLKRKFA